MTATTVSPAAKGSSLDPRTIFMIVAATCLVLLVLWFMLHFKARQQQLSDLNDQLSNVDTQLSDLQSKQAQLPSLRKDVADMTTRQATFSKALPTTEQMGQLLSDLRDNVAASGGTIDSLTSNGSNASTTLPSGVKGIDLTLTTKGRFNSVYQTLQAVETMGRFTKIKDVDITLPAPNDTDPNLSSVINMTTYTFDPKAVQPGATPAGTAPGAAPAPAAPAQGGKS